MLRAIAENTRFDKNHLSGIHFSDPEKRLQVSTLTQWALSSLAPQYRPKESTEAFRYPTRLPMEIPTAITEAARPGKILVFRKTEK